jgi:hypothetical protein
VQIVSVNLPASFGFTPLSSNILAAATQRDGTGSPFIGDASIEILNIAPFENGVKVRVNVLWNSPIEFRLAFVIWPYPLRTTSWQGPVFAARIVAATVRPPHHGLGMATLVEL